MHWVSPTADPQVHLHSSYYSLTSFLLPPLLSSSPAMSHIQTSTSTDWSLALSSLPIAISYSLPLWVIRVRYSTARVLSTSFGIPHQLPFSSVFLIPIWSEITHAALPGWTVLSIGFRIPWTADPEQLYSFTIDFLVYLAVAIGFIYQFHPIISKWHPTHWTHSPSHVLEGVSLQDSDLHLGVVDQEEEVLS